MTRLTIDTTMGCRPRPAPGAGHKTSAFAYRDLGTTTMTPCMSVNVNLAAGTGVDLFRLRTAANGPVREGRRPQTGTLQIRSDFDGATRNSEVSSGGLARRGALRNGRLGHRMEPYRDGVPT